MRGDAHQGDRQQRAADTKQSRSRGSLAPDEAGHHRNRGRGDASDRGNDRHGACRKRAIEQHQTDEARHPAMPPQAMPIGVTGTYVATR